MLTTVVLLSILAAAVVSLLRAIRIEDRILEIVSKTVASASFVVLGAVRWSPGDVVGAWFLCALAFCAAGDLLLLGTRSFDAGLLAFLLGHALYIVGFNAALPVGSWSLPILVPIALAAGGAAIWLWPHLGKRRAPVLAYIVAISIMVWGSFSNLHRSSLPWTAAAGASLFYLSDLAVARQRFVRESLVNRTIGLPIYYLGQLLLAISIGAH
jgi:uncharacterized membrane protein YhhN